MMQFLSAAFAAIASGLVGAGIVTAIAVVVDRRITASRGAVVRRIGDPNPPRESSLSASWPIALALLAGFLAAYPVCLGGWPGSPLSEAPLSPDERVFWAVIVFTAAAILDTLPGIPALLRLWILLGAAYFAVHSMLAPFLPGYSTIGRLFLTFSLMAWLLIMRAGFDVSTRHGSWKPFDAVTIGVAIIFMGAAVAGSNSLVLGQLVWALGGGALAVAIGVIARRSLPTAPAYATVLALSLGSLLMLGVFSSDLPWYSALLASFAPMGRFFSRVGPLGKLRGWPTLLVRALLVLAPAALAAGLAVAATTRLSDLTP